MKHKKRSLILIVILFFWLLNINFTSALEKFDINYIKKIWADNYEIYWTNFGNDINNIKIYWDSKELTTLNKRLLNNVIEINNFKKNSWTIYLEKKVTDYSTWTIDGTWSVKLDISKNRIEKSGSITITKQEDWISMKPNYIFEMIMWKYFVVIPFSEWLYSFVNQDNITMDKSMAVNINWVNFNLLKDENDYVNWKSYYNNNEILIPANNLKDVNNVVKLAINGKYSNYVVVNKEKYKLEKPYQTALEDSSGIKYLKLMFNKPNDINDIKNFEIYVNWIKIPQDDSIITLNSLIIKFDILKYPKTDKNFNIFIKNLYTNEYSNNLIFNSENITNNRITKIDLWNWKNDVFNMKIYSNETWLAGDIFKLKFNINWVDYTRKWINELIKDSDWVEIKNSSNKINYFNFALSGDIVEGPFKYSLFKNGENIIYIVNGNNWLESNKISFIKWDYKNINYDYSKVDATLNSDKIIESFYYDWWSNESNKEIDFTTKSDKNVNLGKIRFESLRKEENYKINFKITSNIKKNPFSNFKLGKESLIPILEKDWNISYLFESISKGKDIKSDYLTASINDIFNIKENPVIFNISWFLIQKFMPDWTLTKVFSSNVNQEFKFSYLYKYWNCFDAKNDSCLKAQLIDPVLIVNTTFNKNFINTTNQNNSNNSLSDNNSNLNSEILVLDFNNQKNIVLNSKFVKLYDKLKTKPFTSWELISMKEYINKIIVYLKLLEDKKWVKSILTSNWLVEDEVWIKEINSKIKENVRKILLIFKKLNK